MLKISHAWGFRVDIPTGKFPLWVGNIKAKKVILHFVLEVAGITHFGES